MNPALPPGPPNTSPLPPRPNSPRAFGGYSNSDSEGSDSGGLRRELREVRRDLKQMRDERDPDLRVGIERLQRRAAEQQRVVEADGASGGATAGSSTAPPASGTNPPPSGPSGDQVPATGLHADVERTVKRVKEQLVTGREQIMEKISKYTEKVDWKLPGRSAVRVAAWFIPLLFAETTANREVEELIRVGELEGSRYASEMRRLGKTLTSMVKDPQCDVFNSESSERVARTLAGYFRALERARSKSGWKQPKGPAGQKWKSKVQMEFFDRIDWDKVEGSSRRFAPLEREMQDDMQQEATFEKYHSKVGGRADEEDGGS